MKVTVPLAKEIARSKRIQAVKCKERLRDFIDIWTGGELDCFQLDLLTDLVWKEI